MGPNEIAWRRPTPTHSNTDWPLVASIARYLIVSVATYVYLLAMIFGLVDLGGFGKVPAYVLAYASSYVLEYTCTLYFVFRGAHGWSKLLRFGIYILGFLLLGTLLFDYFITQGLHYLVAPVVTSIALMPARYLVNRFWVYR